jgi:hypothetical protein
MIYIECLYPKLIFYLIELIIITYRILEYRKIKRSISKIKEKAFYSLNQLSLHSLIFINPNHKKFVDPVLLESCIEYEGMRLMELFQHHHTNYKLNHLDPFEEIDNKKRKKFGKDHISDSSYELKRNPESFKNLLSLSITDVVETEEDEKEEINCEEKN